jgi:hypothetical protein
MPWTVYSVYLHKPVCVCVCLTCSSVKNQFINMYNNIIYIQWNFTPNFIKHIVLIFHNKELRDFKHNCSDSEIKVMVSLIFN